ncbi:MAG: YdbH domain-containing protein, partial [Lentisphaeria bacterium]
GGGLWCGWYLPGYVGGRLLPQLSAAAGIKGVSAQVRRIGLTGADLAEVRLDLDGCRVVEADSLRVDYVLPLLPWRRDLRITALALSGVKVRAVWKNGILRIPGLYPELVERQQGNAAAGGKSRFKVEEIRLSRCVFQIETDAAVTEIPFSLAMRQNQDGGMACSWSVSCGEDTGDGTLEWRPADGRMTAKFNGALHPKRYSGLIPGMQRWEGPGLVKYAGTLERKNDGRQNVVTATLDLSSLKLTAAGVRLANVDAATPVRLALTGRAGEINYRLTNLAVSGPAGAVLEQVDGTLTTAGGLLQTSGKLRARALAGALGSPALALQQELGMEADYQGQWTAAKRRGSWKLHGRTTGANAPAARLLAGGGRLVAKELELVAGGDVDSSGKTVALEALAELKMQPGARWTKAGPAGRPPVTVTADVPSLKVAARLAAGAWSGRAVLSTAVVNASPLGLQANGISLTLPLAVGEPAGRLKVENILLNGRHLADVDLAVVRDETAVRLDGSLKQDFLPGADWKCRAVVNFKPYLTGELNLQIDPYTPPAPLPLGDYWPSMAGMTFNGKLEGGFSYRFGGGAMGGSAFFRLRDGVVGSAQHDFEISGIKAELRLPALPSLQTPPSQRLACGRFRLGKTMVSEVAADFQIGGDGALLLENFSAGWCGGRLYTHALRLTPGQPNWKATVYCDGLNLAQLIRELGIADAEGQGAVHGRIPVTFGAAGIRLEPGFLYSVPGEDNQIQVRQMEHVLDGIPPDLPQYSQLDLAVEALKHFDYQWAKLNFQTTGDDLRVEMHLDGKPMQPLPFAFRNGEWVRVAGPGAAFQGIRLDVNVAVPLNRLLQFNQRIQNLLKGKK